MSEHKISSEQQKLKAIFENEIHHKEFKSSENKIIPLKPLTNQSEMFSSIDDVLKSIRDKYSVVFPPSILLYLNENIKNSKIDFHSAHSVICASIENVRSSGISWVKYDDMQYFAVYRKDSLNLNPGDIIVRQIEEGTGTKYSAFKLLADSTQVFLGTESDFPTLKERIERYVVCKSIIDKLTETISINDSKTLNSIDMSAKSTSCDMDM